MAKSPRSVKLYRKAEAALISAIEAYNKPDFKYREETFSILALNAWELLLKAKLLHESGNKLQCLHVYEPRKTITGAVSKKRYLKRNRAGNPHTLGLGQTIVALEQAKSTTLAQEIRNNLDALTEIRDNAVHYINASPRLAKRVLELGTAAVKNFIELAKRWFNEDLSRYNLFLMPIGFVSAPATAILLRLPGEEKNLLEYLRSLAENQTETSDFQTFMELHVSMKRVRPGKGEVSVALDKNDPNAMAITMTEEQIRDIYPWDYGVLTQRLQARYVDFRANQKYHAVRKPLNQDYRFGHPGTDSIAEPRLRCNVFALLSRSILLSSPVRLQIGSGQGVPATPAATLPTPLRPCLSATPRSGCPALAALPSGHRQRPDPAQHVTEQPPVQMSLGQQQPVVAGMFDQTAAGLH